ncbi:small conductance calcium-activated potassium channel protein 3 [Aplysia californica]|uniref:Small conductance calcium-activated potassium channel protein 3 n=1 Tax=Aplysia californica TaxID=6500 RepID=A0ABM0K2S0_APLCA|nr:small conductance calcium-activated potassium channel protein 3 [Aplysia californica]
MSTSDMTPDEEERIELLHNEIPKPQEMASRGVPKAAKRSPWSGMMARQGHSGSHRINRLKPGSRFVLTKDGLRMACSSQEEHDDQAALLEPDRKRPMTSRYLDITLIPDRPPEPRAMFSKKLGARIELRKQLLLRRRWLVDLMLAVAITGIILMVIENELYYIDTSEKDTTVSLMLKIFMSISTAVLLVAICLYYHTGAEIKMLDAKVDDPLAVTSFATWACLASELLVCAVHPFPGDIKAYMSTIGGHMGKYHMDGILSVLMMFRLYLVGRFLVVHSPLLTDESTQTISAVSHVKISMFFVFKAAMSDHPGTVITLTMLSMYTISVWAMRTCEMYYTSIDEAHSFTESMWLSAITFLTVGYGDLTPETHCGRFIAIVTGLMGLASTALLVAVVAKKLEQTRSERYVFNYLSLIHLEHKRKGAAADVIKFAIKVYTLKKILARHNSKMNRMNVTYMSWRLSNSIRAMRSTRVARLRVEEASVGLTELSQQVSQTQSLISMLATSQGQILDKLTDLQERVRERDYDEDIFSTDEGTGKDDRGSRDPGKDEAESGWLGTGLLKNLYRQNPGDN